MSLSWVLIVSSKDLFFFGVHLCWLENRSSPELRFFFLKERLCWCGSPEQKTFFFENVFADGRISPLRLERLLFTKISVSEMMRELCWYHQMEVYLRKFKYHWSKIQSNKAWTIDSCVKFQLSEEGWICSEWDPCHFCFLGIFEANFIMFLVIWEASFYLIFGRKIFI